MRAALPHQGSPAPPSAAVFTSANANVANLDNYLDNGEGSAAVPPDDAASPTLSVTHVGGDEEYEDLVSPVQDEDTDVDRQTKAIEFHGSTSSIALLRDLQMSLGRLFRGSHQQQQPEIPVARPNGGGGSNQQQQQQQPLPFSPLNDDSHRRLNLVSELRNTSFTPRAGTEGNATMQQKNLYANEAPYFIDAYFQNFHFIHPFIDKEVFRRRAADLWAAGGPDRDMCFFCTYLGLMSLGALVGEWEWEGDRLGGLSRFEWSRKLFDEALANLADLHFPANLDTVHCLYLCAKVCQNELNHNMAYLYSGFAVRICLTAGFNQDNGGGGFNSSSNLSSSLQISRTWWGLYSLEMELSFALGRPDTLGLDEYHDRPLPPVDDSEFAIIPLMVDFARIVRRIAIGIYHSRVSWQQKLLRAQGLESELDGWISGLPERIRPACLSSSSSSSFSTGALAALRQPKWCRRQKIITEIRYHNVRMLLFRPFLSMLTRSSGPPPPAVNEAVDKCIASAKRTIEVVHEAMIANSFFRTWWDNTTHILFATGVLLLHTSRGGQDFQGPNTAPQVDVAVEILEAMDECMVAGKSANIIRRMLAQVKGQPAPILKTAAESDNDKNSQTYLDYSVTMAGNNGSGLFMTDALDFVRNPLR